MSATTATPTPANSPAKPSPWRPWDCSGLWEHFRIDRATVRARSEAEAKRVFRNRYKNPRSVTGISARPSCSPSP